MEAIALVVGAILYFLPAINAASRKHCSRGAIFLLNLVLGWTVVGWLWAVIWSATGNVEPKGPTPATHVKCPDCRELVLHDAKVCKHCGCKLIPQ